MMTKHSLFLFVAGLMALVLTGCGHKSDKNAPAKVVYEQTDIDLGDIYAEDGPKKVKFKVKNDGGGAFRIVNVASTCDCTDAEYSSDFVYGGESTTINVTLNVAKLYDGGFERMIGVQTDLKQQLDTLYFHGVVKHRK